MTARGKRGLAQRVIELYLNWIEFGPDVYGVGPAARYYFQKDARQLTPLEATFLAMLKPAPRQGPWMVRKGRTFQGRWWGERTEELMRRLVEHGYVTQAAVDAERPFALRWESGRYLPSTPAPKAPGLKRLREVYD